MYTKHWKDNENLTKNELIKLEKDGLEIIKELDKLSSMNYEDIDPADIERLKWAGFYTQRPKNGLFLIRVKHPSGLLTSEQAKKIAEISKKYGQDSVQITIRQCIQVHNIELKHLAEVYRQIQSVGLTSVEGCGDVPRNILGNPLAGIDRDELFDTRETIDQLVDELVENPDYSNLPRKYKISVSANPADCGFAGINDLAFVPAVYRKQGEDLKGFHIYAGGGLSREPRLAKKLPFFIVPDQAVDVAKALAIIFRDHGYRDSRTHCRIRVLVEDWGVEKVSQEIEKITGPLRRGGRTVWKKWNRGVFHGIHKQKQEGLYYVGSLIPSGSMTADELYAFAELAEKYGDGQLRTTNSQNILVINIPEENLKAYRKEALLKKYPLRGDAFTGYCASCTGNHYCSFAPIDSKKWTADIVAALHEKFPDQKEPLRVNVTGCIHSCAHPQIADIGITGGKARVNGQSSDAFKLQIGGALGKNMRFASPLQGQIAGADLINAIIDLVSFYRDNKEENEVFYEFVERTEIEKFQELVEKYIIKK